jgi:hypothetical protein
VKQEIPTYEEWLKAKFYLPTNRKKFKVEGVGLSGLAKQMDVVNNTSKAITKEKCLELGAIIYGEEEVRKYNEKKKEEEEQKKKEEERHRSELIVTMKQKIPTYEEWLKVKFYSAKNVKEFNVGGVTLRQFTRILGCEYVENVSREVYLELGEVIYGEEEVMEYNKKKEQEEERKQKEKETYRNELIVAVKQKIPTYEEWLKAKFYSAKNAKKFNVEGLTFRQFARILEYKGVKEYLELGEMIYGEEEVMKYNEKKKQEEEWKQKKEEMRRNKLIVAVKQKIPTYEKWLKAKFYLSDNMAQFNVKGLELSQLAQTFGFTFYTKKLNKEEYIALGSIIYGEEAKEINDHLKQQKRRTQLRIAIEEKFPTYQDWLDEFKPYLLTLYIIPGIEIYDIALEFGMDSFNYYDPVQYAELCIKIYGDEEGYQDFKKLIKYLDIVDYYDDIENFIALGMQILKFKKYKSLRSQAMKTIMSKFKIQAKQAIIEFMDSGNPNLNLKYYSYLMNLMNGLNA